MVALPRSRRVEVIFPWKKSKLFDSITSPTSTDYSAYFYRITRNLTHTQALSNTSYEDL